VPAGAVDVLFLAEQRLTEASGLPATGVLIRADAKLASTPPDLAGALPVARGRRPDALRGHALLRNADAERIASAGSASGSPAVPFEAPLQRVRPGAEGLRRFAVLAPLPARPFEAMPEPSVKRAALPRSDAVPA